MKVKFDIYLPFENHEIELVETTSLLIDELIENSRLISIPLDNFGEVDLEIKKTSIKKVKELKKKYPTFYTKKYLDIIHFASTIEFDAIYEYEDSKMHELISKDTANFSLITAIFESRFKNFLTFTQLAIPSSLLTDKGLFFRDDKYYHDFSLHSSILLNDLYEKDMIWPQINRLAIRKVWNYIKYETSILTKKSETKIENGLNAFSYLIENNSDSMQSLFWAMSGIEALYAEGEIGIGYQIDMKAKHIFGEPIENKSLLKKLYNFRSKFLHGNMKIPINYGWLSEDDEDEYDEEFYNMKCLATRLLTATLQMIIKKDLKRFDFEFKLIE